MAGTFVRREHRRPHRKQGWARSIGRSAHPELWNGLGWGIVPALGHEGDRKHDVSGNWYNGQSASPGQPLLGNGPDGEWMQCPFFNAGGILELPDPVAANQTPLDFTFVAVLRSDGSQARSRIYTHEFAGGGIRFESSGGIDFYWPNTFSLLRSTTPIDTGELVVLACEQVNNVNKRILIDGEVDVVGEPGASTWQAPTADGTMLMGQRLNNTSDLLYDAELYAFYFYSRVLTPGEHRLLAEDYLAAFRLRPQRFYYPTEAAELIAAGTGTFVENADGQIELFSLGEATGTFVENADGNVTQVLTATGTFTENTNGGITVFPPRFGDATGTFAESADGDIQVLLLADGTGTYTEDADGDVGVIPLQAADATGTFSDGADGDIQVIFTGWTDFTPSVDTTIVYVSSSDGDDGNDGLTELTAKATIAAGAALIRDGFPDWLLLKKGDVWDDQNFGNWNFKGGRSETEPCLIGSYGTGARPLVRIPANSFGWRVTQGVSYVAIAGIHFHAWRKDPDSVGYQDHTISGTAIDYLSFNNSNQDTYLLIEDCYCETCGIVIQRQGITTDLDSNRVADLRIRRSIVEGVFSSTSDASGAYIYGVDGILIEECIFDHNGWYGDRDTGGITDGEATARNHNIYCDNENPSLIANTGDARNYIDIRKNIFTRGSASAFQMRPGGNFQDNLCVENANVKMGGGSQDSGNTSPFTPDGADMDVRRNVVLNGVDVNSSILLGVGFQVANLRNGALIDNIVSQAISLVGKGSVFSKTLNAAPAIQYDDNKFYQWPRSAVDQPNSGPLYTLTSEERNCYWDAASVPWPVTGTNRNSESIAFVDPTRDIASYNASLGGQASLEAFVNECFQQSRDNWRPQYTAIEANQYIRDGFDEIGIIAARGDGTFTENADGNVIIDVVLAEATGTFTENADGAVTASLILEGQATGTFTESADGDITVQLVGDATGTFTESADGDIGVLTLVAGTASGGFVEGADGNVTEVGIADGIGVGTFTEDADGDVASTAILQPTATGTFVESADGQLLLQPIAAALGTFTEDADGLVLAGVQVISVSRLCLVPKQERICIIWEK